MKLLITALAGCVLLSGCVQPTVGQMPRQTLPLSQPLLLSEFSQQMETARQQANAGDHASQQQYGRWLASAGDDRAAKSLLSDAARGGDAEAQYQLGLLLLATEGAEGEQWLKRAAEQGHTAAAYQLARFHRSGNKVVQDPQQAFKWLLQAAQQGDAKAQNDVGAAYSHGNGVNKDPSRAFEWYRKAAQQGYALAQFNLAGAYQSGEGVKVQPLQAYAWYSMAVQNSRDVRLTQIAEQMKLRMYANASRTGNAAQARQLAQLLSQQYVKNHEDALP